MLTHATAVTSAPQKAHICRYHYILTLCVAGVHPTSTLLRVQPPPRPDPTQDVDKVVQLATHRGHAHDTSLVLFLTLNITMAHCPGATQSKRNSQKDEIMQASLVSEILLFLLAHPLPLQGDLVAFRLAVKKLTVDTATHFIRCWGLREPNYIDAYIDN